jgi:hypothetical protein
MLVRINNGKGTPNAHVGRALGSQLQETSQAQMKRTEGWGRGAHFLVLVCDCGQPRRPCHLIRRLLGNQLCVPPHRHSSARRGRRQTWAHQARMCSAPVVHAPCTGALRSPPGSHSFRLAILLSTFGPTSAALVRDVCACDCPQATCQHHPRPICADLFQAARADLLGWAGHIWCPGAGKRGACDRPM